MLQRYHTNNAVRYAKPPMFSAVTSRYAARRVTVAVRFDAATKYRCRIMLSAYVPFSA